MAKVKFIKKARTDHPGGIKAGYSYYTWSLMYGGRGVRQYSKTPPKPSQLTSSSFRQQYLAIGENLSAALNQEGITPEDFEGIRDEATGEIESLRNEVEGNKDNLPENLQNSSQADMMQERIDGLQQWQDDLEGVSLDDFEFEDDQKPEQEEGESDEDYQTRLAEYKESDDYKDRLKQEQESWMNEKRDELEGYDPGL